MFSACGPLAPWVTVKDTAWPSAKVFETCACNSAEVSKTRLLHLDAQ